VSINIQNIVRAEKLSRVLKQNARSVVSSTIVGFLLVLVQARQANIPLNHIYLWSAILVLISMARLVIGYYFLQRPVADANAQQVYMRLNVLRMAIIVTSICWGANVYLTGYMQSMEMLFFCSFIILGLTSSAAVSYAIDTICATAYLFFAVLPLLIYQLNLNTPVTLVMGLACFVYVVFMYYNIDTLNQHLTENIVMRIDAQEKDAHIRQMAFQDALTGLPNRRLLQDRLIHAISMSERNQTSCAIMFLDLNGFKLINDTLGHDTGDLLLQQVAKRLTNAVRESDTVARLGGDEFVVMLENLPGDNQSISAQLDKMVEKILDDFSHPYLLKGRSHNVLPSIGVSIFGQHGRTPEDLLKHADVAMYKAKRAGRNAARM
jgi:diguanylate cyclase (GGDEF)-like protein